MDLENTKKEIDVAKRAIGAHGNELLESIIGILSFNPLASGKSLCDFISTGISIHEQFFLEKLFDFIMGVGASEAEANEFIKKLFSDEASTRENGMRLLAYIDRSETEKSISFIVNATRSLIHGCITREEYFRIVRAISETMYEDLIFLSEHIIEDDVQIGNSQIFALARAGLMISAGINAEADVESQPYTFSSLGRMVDQYAVSYRDEERQQWYNGELSVTTFETQLNVATDEEVEKVINRVFADNDS